MGMVTDRNITNRASAYGHDPNTTPVRHYISSDLICCFEDQDIKEAEELMRQRRVRGLPILTREKQIAGIVALDDLIPVCWIPKKVGPLPPERFRARAERQQWLSR
jgi:CBS domain-containing protein